MYENIFAHSEVWNKTIHYHKNNKQYAKLP